MMDAKDFDVEMLLKMAHSPVHNYVIPGLTSSLIGQPSPNGTIRIFENSRDHQENLTPHSHRFDFQCWVLFGYVINRIWTAVDYPNINDFDLFQLSRLEFGGMGHYATHAICQNAYRYTDSRYNAGECYSMRAEEIHSIQFSRGAKVLFFEGETRTDSEIIEPVVDGEVIRTFHVAPWMFKKG